MVISRLLLILIFSVAQLASGGSVFGLVVCIGEDGHAGIELVHDVCTGSVGSERQAHADSAPDEFLLPDSSCSDVSLSTAAVIAASRTQDRELAFSFSHLPLLADFTLPHIFQYRSAETCRNTSFDSGSSLPSLRSVVLTI